MQQPHEMSAPVLELARALATDITEAVDDLHHVDRAGHWRVTPHPADETGTVLAVEYVRPESGQERPAPTRYVIQVTAEDIGD